MSRKRLPSPIKPDSDIVTSEAPACLELTAYQSGAAVVRERRDVTLREGRNLVSLAGLPTQFIPNSLTIVSVDGEGKLKLGPISYQPANLNTQAILNAAIGTKVTLINETPAGTIQTTGTLRHILGNQLVLEQSGGKVVVVSLTGKFELASGVPAGLSALPSLVMEPTAAQSGEFGFNILYETDGISWSPRYEGFYNAEAEKLTRLACWVEVTNGSGTRLADATFKLLAGSNVGRRRGGHYNLESMPMVAQSASLGGARSKSMRAQADVEVDTAESETVGEQKLYVLTDPLTLATGETKQTILVLATDVPVKPEYFLSAGYYGDVVESRKEDAPKLPVCVRLRLTNDKGSNLGVALPAGEMSIFEPDSSGSLQKTDGSRIGHVAVDEAFKLDLRNPSKDLKATRHLTYFFEDPEPEEVEEPEEPVMPVPVPRPPFPGRPRPLGGPDVGTPEGDARRRQEVFEAAQCKKAEKEKPRYREEEREVTVHNYKDKDVEVLVSESFPADAQFVKKSQDFAEQSQGNGVFRVAVSAKGNTTVSYRIRFRIN